MTVSGPHMPPMTGGEIENELRLQKQERDGAKQSTGMSSAMAEAIIAHALADQLDGDMGDIMAHFGGNLKKLLGSGDMSDRRLRQLITAAKKSRGRRLTFGTHGVWFQTEDELVAAESEILGEIAGEAELVHRAFIEQKRVYSNRGGGSKGRPLLRDSMAGDLRLAVVQSAALSAKKHLKKGGPEFMAHINDALSANGIKPISRATFFRIT